MPSLKQEVGKYFPIDAVNELANDVRGKRYRLTVIEKYKARDLNLICSHTEIKRYNIEDIELMSIEDLGITLYYGDLYPGELTSHVKLLDDGNIQTLKYESSKPVIGNGPILIMKKGTRSDLIKGYTNFEYNNIYIIK